VSNKQLAVIGAVVMVSAMLSYLFIDKSVALFFYGVKESINPIFQPITHFGDSKYYIIGLLVAFFVFRFNGKTMLAARSLFIWLSIACSGIAADILKFIFGRARPKLLFGDGSYGFEFFKIAHSWTSFPSGHATTAISLGVALALLFPRFARAILIFAVVVAFSRVFIAAHFVSDVLIGSLIGGVTAVLLERYFAAHKCFNIYQNGCTLSATNEQGEK